MIDILRTLINYPTISGDAVNNRLALDFIEDYLKTRGMITTRYISNGFESIVATTRPTKTPKIFLAAHLDVVPASAEMFTLTEKDGKLYGRGVLDMKFAIASYLKVVDDLKDELHHYDFGIMITTDEELNGMYGTNYLLQQGYAADTVLLPDGGDNWHMQESARGFAAFKITVNGKTAHGSRPWEGESASMKLHDLITDIRAIFPKEMSPDTDTLNIGTIQGGDAVNQIPDRMEVTLDIRSKDQDQLNSYEAAVKRICQKYGADEEIVANGQVCQVDLTNPYVKKFRELIKTYTGVTETSHTFGTNDIRYLAPKGITAISVYPEGGGHHSGLEWITVEGFETFEKITRDFVTGMAIFDVVKNR